MLLLILAGLWVLVLEDEVNLSKPVSSLFARRKREASYLVGRAALVWTEHDHIWGGIRELLSVQLLVVLQQLHISSAAFKAIL